MKILTRKENEIMDILWAAEDALSAQEICKRSKNFSIYSVQQLLHRLLGLDFIQVDRIVQTEKTFSRLFKPAVSQAEYISFLLGDDNKNISNLFCYFISKNKDKHTLGELQKQIEERINEIGE